MNDKKTPAPNGVRTVTIDARDAGQRIDNFLMTQLKGVPRSRVYNLLRKGQVRLNSGRVKPLKKLKQGDVVRIPPVRVEEQVAALIPQGAIEHLRKSCLFEDEHWVAINKPPGMVVHAGSGFDYGVIEALREVKPEWQRLDLVHRLDRDTSGVLLLAKSAEAVRAGHRLFAEREANKEYFALLDGVMKAETRKVDAPLGLHQQGGEKMVKVDPEGKRALSRFTVVKRFEASTLVSVKIETGRMHQIRVHSLSLGHPVLGDDKYGDREANRALKAQGFKGMFLHARRLRFDFAGEHYDVRAPLPERWGRFAEGVEHG